MPRLGFGPWLVATPCVAIACLIASACLPGAGPADTSGGGAVDDASPINLEGDTGLMRGDVDLGDPFALYGLTPSHGPYTGGTSVRLSGRGFTTKLRVFIGNTEVGALAGDPSRAIVVTPPGAPGPVDVRIRDDATAKERVLVKGFTYDAFVVEPTSGATSGGTHIRLTSAAGSFPAGAKVAIGGAPCNGVAIIAGKIECDTPAGSPGSKDVTVTELDGKSTQARDAFTYSDSPDGYRGGLGGGAFAGRMRVLAFDSTTGAPLPGAFAIATGPLLTSGGDAGPTGGIVQVTSATGVTEMNGLPGDRVTITVAAKCHQPITYVDVPVDTVTAYLPFTADLACAKGDPPSTGGGTGKFGGVVEGEMVFPGGAEFQRTGWTTVPGPTKPTERRAAYVFEVSGSPAETFRLPSASDAITPDSEGAAGYKFALVTFPGNVSLYVVAGLEDRSESPPRFVPYAMGIARGISVPAQTRVTGVDVKMDILFDHQVTLAPQQVPLPGPRGPDRLAASYSMTIGSGGYAILPRSVQVVPLPAPAALPFIGVPSLDHAATGEQYVLGAVAATGAQLQAPASLVSRIRTTNANDPVVLGGFLGVPILNEPATGTWGGTHVQFGGATGPVNLSTTRITSGNGLVTWTIVAPGGVTSFDLPNLRLLPGPDYVGLVDGEISTTVNVGRIDAFSYGSMRQGQISTASWNAHAFDRLDGAY